MTTPQLGPVIKPKLGAAIEPELGTAIKPELGTGITLRLEMSTEGAEPGGSEGGPQLVRAMATAE